MKKIFCILVVLCLAINTGFVQKPGAVNAMAIAEKIDIIGTVKDINIGKDGANLTLEGKKLSNTNYDKASVHIDIHTIITKDNLKRLYHASDIKVGDTVEVIFGGPVLETYPVRGTAKSVRIVTQVSSNKYPVTKAYLSLTNAQRRTVLDMKKAVMEEFVAPDNFTVAYKGEMKNIGHRETLAVSFNTTQDRLLGPIVVFMDSKSLAVLGYGLRR